MILPPATLGLLGGGQLGRYFIMAARELGYRVMVLDPDRHSPAGRIADEHLVAAYDDQHALDHMAKSCAAVTTEFESVPSATLAYLAQSVPVRPGAEAVAICQNRSMEKGFLKQHGLPHAPYVDICNEDDVANAPADLFPGILKLVSLGYDGKGQAHVRDRDEALSAWHQFKGAACVLERRMALDGEFSVVLARDSLGNIQCYPASANIHRHGILDISSVPAQAFSGLLGNAEQLACDIAANMAYIGTLSVEFFVVQGRIYVNEIAPRPHNSGHYTLDACVTNQFEQQVRALCDLPLGDVRNHSAAVMVNLLGDLWTHDGDHEIREPDWRTLLSIPGLKLHLYGKHQPRPGRKMGHFTVVGEDQATVYETAMAARAAIGIGAKG